MLRRAILAGGDLDVLDAGGPRARCLAEVPPDRLHPGVAERGAGHGAHADDRRGTWTRLVRQLGRAGLGLANELDRRALEHPVIRLDRPPAHERHPEPRK